MRKFIFILISFLIGGSNSYASERDINDLKNLIRENPKNALSYFNLGALFYGEKNYQNAIKCYRKVVDLKSPLAPAALVYESLALVKLKKISEAKQILSGVKIDELPPNLKRQALKLKNRLFLGDFSDEADLFGNPNSTNPPTQVPTAQDKVLSGFVDLSYGYNSNPKTLSDLSTADSAADQYFQAKAALDLQALAASDYDLKFDYAFSGSFFTQDHSTNYSFHDLTVPIAYYFSTFRVRLTPEYYFDSYGGDPFSQSYGAALDLSKKLGGTMLTLAVNHQVIRNVTSSYSYLTGSQDKLQASVQSQWSSSSTFFNAYAGKLSYQDTSTLSSSYQNLGVNAGYRYFVSAFDFNLTAAYENHAYARAASDSSARNDYKVFGEAQFGYSILKSVRFYLDFTSTNNHSNFNSSTLDRSYKQMTYLFGTSLSF